VSDQGKRQRSSRERRSEAEEQRAHGQDAARSQGGASEAPHPLLLETIRESRVDVDPLVQAVNKYSETLRNNFLSLDQTQPDDTTPKEHEQEIIDQYNVLRVILEKPVPIGGRRYDHEEVTDLDPFNANPARDFASQPPPADWKSSTDPTLSTPPTVSPPSLNFGTRRVDAERTPEGTFEVAPGSQPLQITDVKLDGGGSNQFLMGEDTCKGKTIQPGSICTVNVAFDPNTAGDHSAQLSFTTNRGTLTASLSGKGANGGNVT
jgi:hypothetical protein